MGYEESRKSFPQFKDINLVYLESKNIFLLQNTMKNSWGLV